MHGQGDNHHTTFGGSLTLCSYPVGKQVAEEVRRLVGRNLDLLDAMHMVLPLQVEVLAGDRKGHHVAVGEVREDMGLHIHQEAVPCGGPRSLITCRLFG